MNGAESGSDIADPLLVSEVGSQKDDPSTTDASSTQEVSKDGEVVKPAKTKEELQNNGTIPKDKKPTEQTEQDKDQKEKAPELTPKEQEQMNLN